MNEVLVRLLARFQAEEGQGMVEYSLILALISIAAITILTALGQDVVKVFTSAAGALAAA